MPDSPDYEKYRPGSVRFSLQDMGELAARLGSISIYDRRGEIVWYDNFSHGLAVYNTSTSGTGAGVSLTAGYSHRYPYSALLITGSTLSLSATIEKYLGTFGSARFGVEFGVAFANRNDYLQVTFQANQGDDNYLGSLRIFPDTGIAQIRNGLGSFVQASIVNVPISSPPSFLSVKLVCDFATNKYVRLLVSHVEIDLTTYDLYNDGDTGAGEVAFQIMGVGDSGFNSNYHLSYIIVTANEP